MSATDRFLALSHRHRVELGVTWQMSENRWIRGWMFHNFRRFDGAPGNGTIALREVCALADELSLKVTLWAQGPWLREFYKAHGFEPTGRTLFGDPMYERQPQKETV